MAGQTKEYMPHHRRPVFLDLTRIRMPVNAVVSITHRISGLLLFLVLPLAVYLLSLSLRDEQGYEQVRGLLAGGAMKALGVLVLWALAHHVYAGIRFLLIDIKVGVERETFKRGARIVNVLSLLTLLLAGGLMFS